MFPGWPGLRLMPPLHWRVVSVSHDPLGLRMPEGNLGDFLKENQEAVPEERGLDDSRQRKTTGIHRGGVCGEV